MPPNVPAIWLILGKPPNFRRARHAQARSSSFFSKVSMAAPFCIVRPMPSRPLSRQCLRKGSMSNLTVPPSGPRISWFSRSIVSVALAPRSASSNSFSRFSGDDHDGQNAVLEAVVVEDVGEARGDHAADAEIEQRPGRVLARRTAAEIVARDEDLGLPIGRLVEHEIRVLRTVVAIAHLGEEADAEAGALDGLEVLLGDDHVGIDIDDPHRRRDAFQHSELVHRPHSLKTTRIPATASYQSRPPSTRPMVAHPLFRRLPLRKNPFHETTFRGSASWISWCCFACSAGARSWRGSATAAAAIGVFFAALALTAADYLHHATDALTLSF